MYCFVLPRYEGCGKTFEIISHFYFCYRYFRVLINKEKLSINKEMSKAIKRAASTLKLLDEGGVTFESCLDDGYHAMELNKWLIECAWEVANKG